MLKSRLGWLSIVLLTIVLPSCNQLISFPAPVLTGLSPNTYVAGQPPSPPLVAIGDNFTPSSVVELSFNGGAPSPRTTIFTGDVHHLTATLLASDVQNPAEISVTVATPSPGGGTSVAQILTITPLSSPVPHIASINPSGVLVGTGGFNLIITGTGFVTHSTATLNGNNLTTAFQNATTLLAAIPSSLLVTPGVFDVTVLNPTEPPPGGGSSNIVELTVSNPLPTITAVSPTSVQAGTTAPPALSVTGTSFAPLSQILINGTARTTTFLNGTSVTTPLTAGDVADGNVDQIQVSNPGPGGGASNILPFAVTPTATAGLPVLVDQDSDGSQPNNALCGPTCSGTTPDLSTVGPAGSKDGRFVAFASNSSTLIANVTTSGSNIFLRDTCLGQAGCTPLTVLQSVGISGTAASGASTEPAVNGGSGGPFIAFTSTATNLVSNVPVNGTNRQVYWRTACTTASACATASGSTTTSSTFLVSVSGDRTSAGNGDSFNPSVSPDGRFVAFVSFATNLVTNVVLDGVTPQIFLTDTCSGVLPTSSTSCVPSTILVSSADGVMPANAPSSNPSVAANGLFVSFTSKADNLGLSAPNAGGGTEIFERSTCFHAATTCAAATTLISSPDGIAPANAASIQSSISQEGRFIAFASGATNLIAGVGPVQQIYRRDTCIGQTSAACKPSILLISTPNGTSQAVALAEHPSMDPTGQFVAFASLASNLSPDAANGVENIYVRNTCTLPTTTTTTTTTCAITTVLASRPGGTSPPPANGNSLAPSLSGDGKTVSFISSASNLVSGDRNNSPDVFVGATSF